MDYLWLKWIHIVSATILFGTGIGIAFFKAWVDRHGNIEAQHVVNRTVVLADWLFTAPAVVVQFATGIGLALKAGYPLHTGWVFWALVLFFVAGACWLPVVWLQLRMREQSRIACESGEALSSHYHRDKVIWRALGVPAFGALVIVFYLMVFKPGW